MHRIVVGLGKPLLAASVVLLAAACSSAGSLASASPQPTAEAPHATAASPQPTAEASQATAASPQPTLCDAWMTGSPCELPEPEFASSSCQDLAAEWADSLDTIVIGTLGGPETVDDGTLSDRISSAVDVATTKAIARLDALGLKADCPETEFLAAAEHLSPATYDRIGWVLYDMNPDGFDLWFADVQQVLHEAYEGGGG
jgi:hypothetical protein